MANHKGEIVNYRVVGPDEFDLSKGWISLDSPVGRALIGTRKGDEVRVRVPKGEATYTVISYRYHPAA